MCFSFLFLFKKKKHFNYFPCFIIQTFIVLLKEKKKPTGFCVWMWKEKKEIFNFLFFENQSQTLCLEYYTWGYVCNKVLLLCFETLLCAMMASKVIPKCPKYLECVG